MRWLGKRAASFRYAFQGIRYLFKTQANFRIHVIVAVAVIIPGVVFKISGLEWCMIIFAIGLVIAAEAFNTSLEVLTDLVSPDHNEKAKIIKDVAVAAVLIAAIVAAVIGVVVFGERIWNLFYVKV